jgi:hypothetical protein
MKTFENTMKIEVSYKGETHRLEDDSFKYNRFEALKRKTPERLVKIVRHLSIKKVPIRELTITNIK